MGLRRRLYTLSFVDEFAPLYALFTLWFNDNGISTPQLSVVFIMWASLSIVLEVPSGAVADRVDRRKLVGAAFALRAVGIGIWLVWPTITGLLIGATLWAVHDAAASGAWEALIHDELEAVGDDASYGVVIARVGQFSNIGLAAGTIAATGLLRVGVGIEAIGWVNVAIHAVSIVLVLGLTDVRWVVHGDHDVEDVDTDDLEPTSYGAWWATLRSGVSTARRDPLLLRLIIVGMLLGGLFVVDEYIPLLARERGASDTVIPLIVLAVWLGLIAGGELAARRPNMAGGDLATGVVIGAGCMAVAIALDSPWALAGVGVGYGFVETAWVIADARFQRSAPKATRATVTSVRSLGVGGVGALAFAVIAALSNGDDPSPGLHWIIGIVALTAVPLWRWLPSAKAAR